MRNDIVTEARSWVGTRFHHQGRVKRTSTHKGGVDCIGLIIGVAQHCGITFDGKEASALDDRTYGIVPDGDKLKNAFSAHIIQKPKQELVAGDVALFRFEQDPQHAAIIGELAGGELSLIHSYRAAGGVVEHRFDQLWWERCVAAFQFPGVN